MRRFLSAEEAASDVHWDGMHLAIPDVQATACVLAISKMVLGMGRELALSIGCSTHSETLVIKKFSRAICTVCRIALVARMTGSARDDSQPHSDMCEAQLLSANDMRVLSVALARAAVEFSHRTVIVARPLLQPQARCIISDLSLLSRSACMKARECCAAAMNHLTRAAASSLERCGTAACSCVVAS